MRWGRKNASTLMELLIVVGIIAILTLLAYPGYKEAQARSRVSIAKSDMRRLSTGLEAYRVDYGVYPKGNNFNIGKARTSVPDPPHFVVLERLSTPIAYLATGLIVDQFKAHYRSGPINSTDGSFFPIPLTADEAEDHRYYRYGTFGPGGGTPFQGPIIDVESSVEEARWFYALHSPGPASVHLNPSGLLPVSTTDQAILSWVYDPSNGTNSRGVIIRIGGVTTQEPNAGSRLFRLAGER